MSTEDKILQLVKEADPDEPIEYVSSIVRSFARQKLDDTIRTCHDCKACQFRHLHSVTAGNDNASVMIINEGIYDSQFQLSKEEVKPLEGTEEMEYMNAIIDAYHINRNQLFWVNAMNCKPYEEVNGKLIPRTPNRHETECCSGYIDYAIRVIQPVMIILLGNIPLNICWPQGKTIGEMHGKWIDVHGIRTMPVYSPHALIMMRDQDNGLQSVEDYENDFCDDLKAAFSFIQEEYGYGEDNILLAPLEDN